MSKLSTLLPNTRRSFFADNIMIYSESSITRSDLIQSNLQTSIDDFTLLNSDHCIILSCTESVGVLFERKKSNRVKPQGVTYNGQVIPSSFVKFLGITFDSALTFWSRFLTSATLAHHCIFNLWPLNLYPHHKFYICSLLDYGAPAICVASLDLQISWGYKLISFLKHFPFQHSSTTTENGRLLTFHPSMTETCT